MFPWILFKWKRWMYCMCLKYFILSTLIKYFSIIWKMYSWLLQEFIKSLLSLCNWIRYMYLKYEWNNLFTRILFINLMDNMYYMSITSINLYISYHILIMFTRILCNSNKWIWCYLYCLSNCRKCCWML